MVFFWVFPCKATAQVCRGPASLARTLVTNTPVSGDSDGSCKDAALSPELVGAYEVVKKDEKPVDLNNYVPTDLSTGQDPNLVATKIADKSVQYWWNNSEVKKSPIGQTMDKAEKSVQKDVDLGSTSNPQKLNLGMDLFQTRARIKYEGYAKAELFYQLRDSSAGLNVIKKLDATKDLILGESMRSSADTSSDVKFRWAW